jgi:biopolymer transport protein ExbD
MNVTPLVDVMLVLLIIFMVTVPTASFSNQVDFTPAPPNAQSLEPLRVHIGAGDTLALGGQPVTMAELRVRFATAAMQGMVAGKLDPKRQPEVLLAIEPEAEYALVAQVMALAKNQQLERIGFAD